MQAGRKALTGRRLDRMTFDLHRRRELEQVEECGSDIADMTKLMAQLAACGQALGPSHDQRVANAATMRVLLVASQWRIRIHRPAKREIGVGIEPADVVDAGDFGRQRLLQKIERPHGVDHAERPALLTRAVIGQHQHQRIVSQAGIVQKGHQPSQMLISVIKHRGIGRLQTNKERLFIGAGGIPGFDTRVVRRQCRTGRHHPHLDLAREAPFALDIPAVGESLVIAANEIGGRLMRRMTGRQRQHREPGSARPIGFMIRDHPDRLGDQIFGQVIAGFEAAGRVDQGIVLNQFRAELVGLGVKKTVKTIETAPQGPAVEGATRAAFGHRRHMPLANHVVVEAMRAEHFGKCRGVARNLAAIAGKAAVEIGQTAHPHIMVIAPGQQRRTGGRAHRRRVKTCVAHALRGDRVNRGRRNR